MSVLNRNSGLLLNHSEVVNALKALRTTLNDITKSFARSDAKDVYDFVAALEERESRYSPAGYDLRAVMYVYEINVVGSSVTKELLDLRKNCLFATDVFINLVEKYVLQ